MSGRRQFWRSVYWIVKRGQILPGARPAVSWREMTATEARRHYPVLRLYRGRPSCIYGAARVPDDLHALLEEEWAEQARCREEMDASRRREARMLADWAATLPTPARLPRRLWR